MALEGTIKDFGLADILQLIGIQRKTGVLTMDSADDTVTVKFLDGQVVAADTRLRNLEDLLGSVLVRTGRITEAQLQAALTLQKSTLQRLGYILVKSRAIGEQDLRDSLRIQVSQIVYRLFRWREGRYHFSPADHVDYDEEHFTPVSAETVLMEGARMIDEWPVIERRIKSPKMAFRKTEAGASLDRPVASLVDDDVDFEFDLAGAKEETDPDEVKVSAEEFEVLHMVDGKATVQDLVDRSPMGEFDVYRTLYELLTRNLIEEVRVAASPGVAEAERRRDRMLSAGLVAGVFTLAVLSLATVDRNPLTPWRVAGVREDGDLLKYYASEVRLERVERALQVFYLDLGSVPEALDVLVAGGYLDASDLLDPWGRSYEFSKTSAGYVISGRDASGRPDDGLRVRRTFTPFQRLVLGSSDGR